MPSEGNNRGKRKSERPKSGTSTALIVVCASVACVVFLGLVAVGAYFAFSKSSKKDVAAETDHFEKAYRAAKAIEGATDVGVNRNEFNRLLQAFSTELASIKHSNSDRDMAREKQYREALEIYKDSATLWNLPAEMKSDGEYMQKLAVERGASAEEIADNQNYLTALAGGDIPVARADGNRIQTVAQALAKRYNLTLVTERGYRRISGESYMILWELARKRIEAATQP